MAEQPTYEALQKRLQALERDEVRHRRLAQELAYETNFRRVLGVVANEFITATLAKLDRSIERALEAIGDFVGADRSYVIQFDFEADVVTNTHEWCRPGIDPQIDNLQQVPIAVFSWVIDQLIALRVVHIPRVADLPAEAAVVKAEFEEEGIQSLLLVPLVSEGRCIGTVGFDFVRQARSSSPGEIRLLEMAGSTLINALERKRAEVELKRSHQTLLAVLDGIDATVYVADMETHEILYMNKNMINAFGHDFTGRICHEVFRGESEVCDHCTNDQLLDVNGNPAGVCVWEKENPITGRWYLNHDRAIWWVDGRIVRLQIATDISRIKALEQERTQNEAQLRQAQKMESVGRLAGGVAHDFNNMLGVILGHAELSLAQVGPGSPLRANLDEIHRTAQRSADFTRQLLAFARKQTAVPRVIDLNHTVAGSINMLRRLIGENIELLWQPGENLWPVKIDPTQVDQILTNLCINARDAIHEIGRIDIFTENLTVEDASSAGESGLAPGAYVVLAVSDNGCGIDTGARERLFEPFFTTKGVGEGTGLGLATVYGIVRQNGGHIDVHSEPGQGATFKIALPMTDEASLQEASPAEINATGSETLLLVEDEAAILKLGKVALERFGYTVLATRTPGEAIAAVEQHAGPIALMVTDVVMPEMNGKALSARIQQLRPGIKVLYMSGYPADVLGPGEILEADVDFLPKPFSISALTAAVRRALDREA